MIYILLFICAIIQGLGKACSDSIISFKWNISYWSKFNIDGYFGISNNQKNKYKNHIILNWLWRNTLVCFADFWHGANTIQMLAQTSSLFIALSFKIETLYEVLILGFGYWIVRSTIFHVFYTYVFLNKKYQKLN